MTFVLFNLFFVIYHRFRSSEFAWTNYFICLLLAPILFYPFSFFGIPVWLLGPVLSVGLFFFLNSSSRGREPFSFFLPLVFFGILFALFGVLSILWGDIYPIAERMRDFSILNAVQKNYFAPAEPWLSGRNLHYYLYLYRLGLFWGEGPLPPIYLYSILNAFFFSLFGLSSFLALKKERSTAISLFGTVVLLLGSNVMGIITSFKGNHWWEASRVIEGTINEFPFWSFLLGDLHPHFMGLFFVPLYFYWRKHPPVYRPIFSVFFLLLIYCANTWAFPFFLVWCLYDCLIFYKECFWKNEIANREFWFFVIGVLILFWWSSELPKLKLPLRFLISNSIQSAFNSYVFHWGLFLVGLFVVWAQKNWVHWLLVFFISCLSFYVEKAWPLLLFLSLGYFYFFLRGKKEFGLFAVCIFFLLGLEFIYFDDAYVMPFERMNTVFKFYSLIWPLLGILLLRYLQQQKYYLFFIPFLIFPFYGSYLRISEKNSLGSFRGVKSLYLASDLITLGQQLRGKDFVIVEGQTAQSSYDMTAYLASATGQRSYLGWKNHMNLLTRDYQEIKKRDSFIRFIYSDISHDCAKLKRLVLQEGIDLVSFSEMEKRLYPSVKKNHFACFSIFYEGSSVSLYSVR